MDVDAEMKAADTVENPDMLRVLCIKPEVGYNIAPQAFFSARNSAFEFMLSWFI